MSTRPLFKPYIVIPNAKASPANTGSMAADIISAPTIVQWLSMISYQVSWAGTSPVGAVSVQVSNDFSLNPDGSVKTQGIWTTMTFKYNGNEVTSIPVSGDSGNGFIDIDATGAYAMRIVYTATSGVGNIQAVISAKVA